MFVFPQITHCTSRILTLVTSKSYTLMFWILMLFKIAFKNGNVITLVTRISIHWCFDFLWFNWLTWVAGVITFGEKFCIQGRCCSKWGKGRKNEILKKKNIFGPPLLYAPGGSNFDVFWIFHFFAFKTKTTNKMRGRNS